MYVHIYTYIYVHIIYIHIYIYVCTYIHIYICTYMYVCMYVCIYIVSVGGSVCMRAPMRPGIHILVYTYSYTRMANSLPGIRQHTSASVSIRQHPSAYTRIPVSGARANPPASDAAATNSTCVSTCTFVPVKQVK